MAALLTHRLLAMKYKGMLTLAIITGVLAVLSGLAISGKTSTP